MNKGFQKKYSEHEIIEGIENKSEVIITYLIKRLKLDIYFWIKKHGGTKEQAEDNFYNTWEAVLINIKTGKYKEGNFEGYFKTISKNIWYKSIRDRRLERTVVPLDYEMQDRAEEELIETLINEEHCNIVNEKLKELNKECREVLEMKYYKNAKLKDIADRMKISEKFVKTRMYRCKKYLLRLLQEDPDFTIE